MSRMWNSIEILRSVSHGLMWPPWSSLLRFALATGVRYYVDRRVGELSSQMAELERAAPACAIADVAKVLDSSVNRNIVAVMTSDRFQKAQYDFFVKGQESFTWFSGKNTPNILQMIAEQIGALDAALKVSAERRVQKLTYAADNDLADLAATVRRHLDGGWQPHGSLIITPPGVEPTYLQPMV